MYIRRKVFSLLEDEMGEMRYFSTNEFTYDGYEDRYFSDEEDEDDHDAGVAKGALIGAGIAAGTAGVGYGALVGGDKYSKKKHISSKTTHAEANGQGIKGKILKGANKISSGRNAVDEWIKENWKRKAKEGEGAVKNIVKGKGKVLGVGAATLGVGAGVGAGINAVRNHRKHNSED